MNRVPLSRVLRPRKPGPKSKDNKVTPELVTLDCPIYAGFSIAFRRRPPIRLPEVKWLRVPVPAPPTAVLVL